MIEFPRPTYPGDFIACNFYQKPVEFEFFEIVLDADGIIAPDIFELSLQHDGVVYGQLYEFIFGPALFSVDGGTFLSLIMSYGDEQILFQELFGLGGGQVLPVLKSYFSPAAIYDSQEDIVYQDFKLTLMASGASLAAFQWGRHESPSVLAVRPVDEVDSGNFRLITFIDDAYAS